MSFSLGWTAKTIDSIGKRGLFVLPATLCNQTFYFHTHKRLPAPSVVPTMTVENTLGKYLSCVTLRRSSSKSSVLLKASLPWMCPDFSTGRQGWSPNSVKPSAAGPSGQLSAASLCGSLRREFAQLCHNSFISSNNKSTCCRMSSQPAIKTSGTFWSWLCQARQKLVREPW